MAIEDPQKKLFAQMWADNPDNSFRAATLVFPHDTARAMAVYAEWEQDPDIIEERDALIAAADLERQAAFTRAWYGAAIKALTSDNTRERLEALKATAGAFTKTNDEPKGNTYIQNNNFMQVQHFGDDEETERKLRAQQRKLVEDARRPARTI